MAHKKCPMCKGSTTLYVDQPEEFAGIVLVVLGLCLTPVLLGFVVMAFGFVKIHRKREQLGCDSCAWSGIPVTRDPNAAEITEVIVKGLVVAVLLVAVTAWLIYKLFF